jgi:hypothetical protein
MRKRAFIVRLRIGGAAAGLLASGCASSDLSQNGEITSRVAECLPTDAPPPAMVARAIWYPNSSGFGTTDASPLGHATGVIVLAGDKIYFMAWDGTERHFDTLKDIAFLRAITIRVDRLGPSAMLVVESGNRSFDAFELMNKGQFTSDPKVTQDLYDRLQALRAKNPPSDP